ncbi:hypothetical protein E2C01_021032 [Portunus trituberculatus]|uniref:Uncharacterized protein n=1 Tax=Portunus trituberculatus TaxID=210409 RepID=A0A5B7E3B4_PORTR|nr:hypothetical protein [Portunus trituberculatus]
MQVRRDPPRERVCALWHGIILYCESCATQAPLWHTAILTFAAVSFCRHTDATYDLLLKNYRAHYSNTCRDAQLYQCPNAALSAAVWVQEISLFSVGRMVVNELFLEQPVFCG